MLNNIFGDYNNLKKQISNAKGMTVIFPIKYCGIVIKAFAPIINFIMNYDDVTGIIASKQNSGGHVNAEIIYNLGKPALNVFNPKSAVEIEVGWNHNNQYNGQISYYEFVNSSFDTDKSYDTYHDELQGQLFHFLNMIIEFLEKRGYLENVGVTH